MTHRPKRDLMLEATRLTRSGRLQEAAALLQSALHAAGATAQVPSRAATDAEVIDVTWRERASEDGARIVSTGPAVVPRDGAAPPARDTRAEVSPPSPESPPESRAAARPIQAGRQTAQINPADALAAALRQLRGTGDTPDHPVQRPPADFGPGRFVDGEFGNAAGCRSYKLYLPTGYSGQPMPLLVMLHGCHQSPDDFAAGTRMNLQAEAAGCLVLYPAQSSAANPAGCWNWFKRDDQLRGRGEPSILADMTRDVMARHAVDPCRVYAAGLSAGGAMAAVLAVTYPDLLAAVAIHSGLASGVAQDLPSALAAMRGMRSVGGDPSMSAAPPMPTIVFHGDRDRTVHPSNGAHFGAQLDDQLRQADGDAGATRQRGQDPGGHAYTRTLRRDGNGNVVLEHWEVHGGGHAWFGGSRAGSYTDPRGPDASAQMMRFLLSHHR